MDAETLPVLPDTEPTLRKRMKPNFKRSLLQPSFMDVIGVVLLAGFVFYGPRDVFLGDPGLGWHLKAGQLMVERGTVLRTEPFLFLNSGQPWVHQQWLSDIAMWLLWNLGGVSLLAVVFGWLCVLPFLLLTPQPSKFSGAVLLAIVLLLAAITGSIQWLVRPVMFSFVLFALTLRWGKSFETREAALKRSDLAIVGLFLAWANLHPAFVLGFAVFAATFLNCLRNSRKCLSLVAIAAACFGATFVNPYGRALHRSIASLGQSAYFLNLNREWLPPEFGTAFAPFFLLLALSGLLLALKGFRVVSPGAAALAVLFAVLSFLHRRYIPYFALCAIEPLGLILARAVRDPLRERAFPVYTTVAALLMAVVLLPPIRYRLPGADDLALSKLNPGYAALLMQSEIFRGSETRIFNSPDWGGFLTWRLWPRATIYIDDRNSQNGEDRYREFEEVFNALPNWRDVLLEIDAQWVLIEADAPLVKALEKDSEWVRFFASGEPPLVVIFRRK